MSFLKKLLTLGVLALITTSTSVQAALANEHAEPEAKAEEHGNAEGEGHGGGSKEESKAPWVEIETKITELNAKIKSKQESILKLIEEKNHLPNNSPQLTATVKEIVKEHKELTGLVEEYEKKLTLLKYRFPERNAKARKPYERIEVKSIDEMEQSLGIDGKLNRNLRRMRSQFKSKEKIVVAPEEKTKEAPPSPPAKSAPSIEEADSIIIQK